MNTRRDFLLKLTVAAAVPAALGGRADAAPAPGKLKETEPLGKALGYKEDTRNVDSKKYPTHKPDQRCDGCKVYTGKAGAATGPCTTAGNRLVTAAGWCTGYVKKP